MQKYLFSALNALHPLHLYAVHRRHVTSYSSNLYHHDNSFSWVVGVVVPLDRDMLYGACNGMLAS